MPSISFNITQSDALLGTNVSAGTPLIMNITNPLQGDSYFGLETIPNNNGFYDSTITKNLSGSFIINSGISNVVYDDYKMVAVVNSGTAQLTYTPSVNMLGDNVRVRGVVGNLSGSLSNYFTQYEVRVVSSGGYVDPNTETCVNDASDILKQASFLMIPSGYRTGSIFAQNPDNGNGDLTFTRGSSATRVASGSIIESPRTNLLSWSEDFSNGVWGKTNVTITSSAGISPNGTLTATLIVPTTASNEHNVSNSTGPLSPRANYETYSIYAKAAGYNYLGIRVNVNSLWTVSFFNLQNGTIVSSGSNFTNTSIEDVGNGWYRCSITYYNRTANGFQTIPSNNGSSITFSGNGTDGVLMWGVQLEESSTLSPYIPTTSTARTSFAGIVQNGTSGSNISRLDYSYGNCPALLLEPQRTNLALWSQDFNGSGWFFLGSTKVSTTQTDPSGDNTAVNVTWGSGGTGYLYRNATGLTIGVTYTITFYVRSNNGSTFRLYGESLNFSSANFTATSTFQRFTFSYTATTTSGTFGLRGATTNASADLIVAFAQFEAGAYPTTYIPTISTTTTRLADTFTRNNIYTNGLISASGGTWYVEFRVTSDARDNSNSLRIGDSNNALNIVGGLAGTFYGFILSKIVGGSGNNILFSILGISSFVKLAIKWNGTTADVFANGTKVVSSTSFTPTNLPDLTGAFGVPLFIQAMALFNKPLDDADCEIITGATGYDTYSQMATALGYDIV